MFSLSILGYVILDRDFNVLEAKEFTGLKTLFSFLGASGARSKARLSDLFAGSFSKEYIRQLNSIVSEKYPIRFAHITIKDSHIIIIGFTDFLGNILELLSRVTDIEKASEILNTNTIKPCEVHCGVRGVVEGNSITLVFEILYPNDGDIYLEEILNVIPTGCSLIECEKGMVVDGKIIVKKNIEGWSLTRILCKYIVEDPICWEMSIYPVIKYMCRGKKLSRACGSYAIKSFKR